MSGVTCTAPEQNVYLWKNKTGGDFKYIRKNGGTAGAVAQVGKGFGYTFSFTETNGTVKTVNDNHWITGGGGGAVSTSSGPTGGSNGSTWCRWKTEEMVTGLKFVVEALGGGLIAVFANISKGSGIINSSGGNGATKGHSSGIVDCRWWWWWWNYISC